MQDSLTGKMTFFGGSKMVRLFGVGLLALLLQIPVIMIGQLINERQSRQNTVIDEVTSKWGKVQYITGPALVIPYTNRWTEIGNNGQQITRTEIRHAIFLPEKYEAQGQLANQILFRGIYTVPVYRLNLTVSGVFPKPNFAELGIDPGSVAWERAQVSLGISDAHAIQQQTSLSWNGQPISFQPGCENLLEYETGIHAAVNANAEIPQYEFSFPLLLNGALGLYFVPFGQNTNVVLTADSGNPSFQGNWLPTQRNVSDSSFSAQWIIPFQGRNYPQAWTSQTNMSSAIRSSQFGIQLVDLMNAYRMAERSVKYAALFILLTYTAVWLIEILAGVRVHTVQYLLLGAALCLFYLLELSLMEHVGFLLAYLLASLAVVAMVGSYSYAILHNRTRAAIVTAGVSGLYVYLYILLTNGDYALLIGSLGLFVILALVMFLTRHVDWYSTGIHPDS